MCSPPKHVCVLINLSQVVAQNASALLTFLKQNCREEASTYWLFREAGDQLVRLYDYSALPPQQERKWKYTMAMLYYRCATRAARNHSNSTQVRLKCALRCGLWLCVCSGHTTLEVPRQLVNSREYISCRMSTAYTVIGCTDARVGGTHLGDTGVTHNPAGTAPAEGTVIAIAGTT